MSKKKLNLAIIGTGMIANAGHIPAWKNLENDVEIVAVADHLRDRAELVAVKEGIPCAYDDWRRMLEEIQPDLVSVCTPNAYHKEQTIAALEVGAHVLCEKPAATCHADAVAMFEAADRAGRQLFISQTLRFFNHVAAAKELVDHGRLGDVYFADVTGMRRRGIPTWGQFHMKQHSGAGPLYDLGVHQLDALFWLLGNPAVRSVTGALFTRFGNRDEGLKTSLAESGAPLGVLTPRPYDHREFDVEDMATGFIRFANGAVAGFKTSWAANVIQEQFNTVLLGTDGGLSLDPLTLATNLGSYQVDVRPRTPADRAVPFAGHWVLADHILNVLRGREEPVVQRAEVLNVMKTLDAIHRSAREGREISLD